VELVLRLRQALHEAGHDAGADTIGWHLEHRHRTTLSRGHDPPNPDPPRGCTRYALHVSAHLAITTPIVTSTFRKATGQHGAARPSASNRP